ncbi:uncharacterized protein LOC111251306 [Varroa destructor]|uniref:THAP-type domain-containing protein n=1 Tax=Varroa destructor TaxID=109461 RepID=A0A7M7KBZ8_VARDE|nr:uncharacterized protein LOC111251306 [Varroa destructor]
MSLMADGAFRRNGSPSFATALSAELSQNDINALITGASSVRCCLPGCRGAILHRFPKDPVRRRQWLVFCGLPDLPEDIYQRYRLCSQHFDQSELQRVGSIKLNSNAVPTIGRPQHLSGFNPLQPNEASGVLKEILCQALTPRPDDTAFDPEEFF